MVSGWQPPQGHTTAHSLHHALGNLGGRQKTWMLMPSHSPVSPAQLPAQVAPNPPVRRRGRPRKVRVEQPPPPRPVGPPVQPQPAYQLAFNSSSPQPPTAAYGPCTVPALPSPVPSEDMMTAAAAAAAASAAWPLDSVQFERATPCSTDGQAQQPLLLPIPPHALPSNDTQLHNPRSIQTAAPSQALPDPAYALSRRPNGQSSWYTRSECLNILCNFEASMPPLSAHSIDKRRIIMLREATEKQDWAYLTMHQLYCILTTCPELLPDHLKSSPALPQALAVLTNILDSNQTLNPSVLYFFSNYPYSIQTILATWGPAFEKHRYSFTFFATHSINYEQLKHMCEQRRYPPLYRELRNMLGIVSVTLQRLTFTAILRHIWRFIPQNPLKQVFEAQAMVVFQQNLVVNLRRQRETGSVRSHEDDIQDQNSGLELRKILDQYESAFRELASQSVSRHQPHQPQPPSNTAMQFGANNQVARPFAQPVVYTPSAPMDSSTLPRPPPTPAQLPPQSSKRPFKSLLPPSGHKQPQQRVPDPSRFSLHQAHLRSPVLCAHSTSSPLYTFQEGYIRSPMRLSKPGRTIETWSFTMSHDEVQALCRTVHRTTGDPGTRSINETSKTVHLRCVKWTQGPEPPADHIWAATETSWIPYLYISLNDTPLQARKKVHHGKDRPIDITDLLREGENVLKMTVMAESGNMSHLDHLLAIEAIGVASHEAIKQRCLNQSRLSAEQVLQSIKNKLSASSDNDDNDDDEIRIVQSTTTIALREPFSQAKMCDIPVRSRACRHNDCFDLDIFLHTRARKGDASVPDQWKCPVCSADARPPMLLCDGFLEHVRRQLEAQGRAQTRHIIVHRDGSWKPKDEPAEGAGVREAAAANASSPAAPATPAAASASVPRPRSVPADVEVIDLSD